MSPKDQQSSNTLEDFSNDHCNRWLIDQWISLMDTVDNVLIGCKRQWKLTIDQINHLEVIHLLEAELVDILAALLFVHAGSISGDWLPCRLTSPKLWLAFNYTQTHHSRCL